MALSSTQWLKVRDGDAAPPAGSVAKELRTRPKSSATSKPPTPVAEDRTDRLKRILKSVLETQQRQQDRWEPDAQQQGQRWKSMEQIPEAGERRKRKHTGGVTFTCRIAEADSIQLPPLISTGWASPYATTGHTNTPTTCRSGPTGWVAMFFEFLQSWSGLNSLPPAWVEIPEDDSF